MNIKNQTYELSKRFMLNTLACAGLVLLIHSYQNAILMLVMLCTFLLLTFMQHRVMTTEKYVFFGQLILLLPLLFFLPLTGKAIIFSLFYLHTITSFHQSKLKNIPNSYPDFFAFIFILIGIKIELESQIIFALVAAYYLSRITTLFLDTIRSSCNTEDRNND